MLSSVRSNEYDQAAKGAKAARWGIVRGRCVSVQSRLASLIPERAFARLIARAHRRFEPELVRVTRAYPGGGTFIDVGSWYGPWTAWLAPRVDRVIALEPNPEVASVLMRTVGHNVEVICAAASDITGRAMLNVPHSGRGTEGVAFLGSSTASTRCIEVPTLRLDDLEIEDVRLLKIDVEGHELPVLHGAEEILKTHHPVVVVELEHRHGCVEESVEFLVRLGYRGSVLVGDHWLPLECVDLIAYQMGHDTPPRRYLSVASGNGMPYLNNVIFTHESSAFTVA